MFKNKSSLIGVIITVFITAIIVSSVIFIPKYLERKRIEESQTAVYTPENYVGWALSLEALDKVGSQIYAKAPVLEPETPEFERAKKLSYPSKNVPDLLEEFGIAVQKKYSSNYIFSKQKQELLDITENLITDLNTAQSSFKTSTEKENANDANVKEALKKSHLMVQQINTAIEGMSFSEAQSGPIGKYIEDRVDIESFSEPIAYSQIAREYLEYNLNLYKGAFDDYSSDGTIPKKTIDHVKVIVGL